MYLLVLKNKRNHTVLDQRIAWSYREKAPLQYINLKKFN